VLILKGVIMDVYYYDEAGRKISYSLIDEEALYCVAQMLLDAPIDVEYLYTDTNTFNLNTFTWVCN